MAVVYVFSAHSGRVLMSGKRIVCIEADSAEKAAAEFAHVSAKYYHHDGARIKPIVGGPGRVPLIADAVSNSFVFCGRNGVLLRHGGELDRVLPGGRALMKGSVITSYGGAREYAKKHGGYVAVDGMSIRTVKGSKISALVVSEFIDTDALYTSEWAGL